MVIPRGPMIMGRGGKQLPKSGGPKVPEDYTNLTPEPPPSFPLYTLVIKYCLILRILHLLSLKLLRRNLQNSYPEDRWFGPPDNARFVSTSVWVHHHWGTMVTLLSRIVVRASWLGLARLFLNHEPRLGGPSSFTLSVKKRPKHPRSEHCSQRTCLCLRSLLRQVDDALVST